MAAIKAEEDARRKAEEEKRKAEEAKRKAEARAKAEQQWEIAKTEIKKKAGEMLQAAAFFLRKYVVIIAIVCGVVICGSFALFLPWYSDSDWSEWSTIVPENIADREIQSVKEHRYQTRSEVIAETDSVPGGKLLEEWDEETGSESYTQWQREPLAEVEGYTIQTETHYEVQCISPEDGTVTTEVTTEPVSEDESTTVTILFTQYRYVIPETTRMYKFEVWSDWSEWEKGPAEEAVDRIPEERTLYSYRDKLCLWERLTK